MQRSFTSSCIQRVIPSGLTVSKRRRATESKSILLKNWLRSSARHFCAALREFRTRKQKRCKRVILMVGREYSEGTLGSCCAPPLPHKKRRTTSEAKLFQQQSRRQRLEFVIL